MLEQKPAMGPSCMTFFDVKSQLQRVIYERTVAACEKGDGRRDEVRTVEDLEQYRSQMRTRFIESMGGLPPSNTALKARTTGTIDGDGFSIEKVVFESRPGTYVTTNLYLPGDTDEPGGAVLFLCGHAIEGKHHEDYQVVCQHLVKAGLVVLAQDPVGQGERVSFCEAAIDEPAINGGSAEHSYAGCRCLPLGQSLIRYFVHDSMRSLDYLSARPEVDPKKIGVTGSSGGGTQTCAMMICDPRIAAAAPSNFLMSRSSYLYSGGAQDSEQIWTGFTADGYDHEDILISMAPRPVLVGAVDSDFFPIEGTKRTVQRCERFWDLYDRKDLFRLCVDHSTHSFTGKLAGAVTTFFSTHLLGRTAPGDRPRTRPLDPTTLWATPTGQIKTSFDDARDIHDENRLRNDELNRLRASDDESVRKAAAIGWLRGKVLSNRPACELNPRYFFSGNFQEMTLRKILWWSQAGLMNHGILLTDGRTGPPQNGRPLTVAVWDEGTLAINRHTDWIREETSNGRSVLVLDVSGVGEVMPNPINEYPYHGFYGTLYKLADDLIWLGDSMVALRVFDVLRSLDLAGVLDQVDGSEVHLYAYGRQGLYARLAAILDDRVTQIRNSEGIAKFGDWMDSRYYNDHDVKSLLLPDILCHFDLDDLDCWLGGKL